MVEAKKESSRVAAVCLAVLGLVHSTFTAGCLFGWPALLTMLNREGHYTMLCPEKTNVPRPLHCNDVDVYAASIYSTALAAQSFLALPLGLFLDWTGPRGSFLYQAVSVAGILMMTLAPPYAGTGFDPLRVGFILLCLPGISIVTLHLHVGNLFPKIRGIYCAVVSATFGVTSVVFSLFEVLQDSFRVSWVTLLRVEMGILLAFLVFTLLLPTHKFEECDTCGFRWTLRHGFSEWGFYRIAGNVSPVTQSGGGGDVSPSTTSCAERVQSGHVEANVDSERPDAKGPMRFASPTILSEAERDTMSNRTSTDAIPFVQHHDHSHQEASSHADAPPSIPSVRHRRPSSWWSRIVSEMRSFRRLCFSRQFIFLTTVAVFWYFVASFYIASIHLQLSAIGFKILGWPVPAKDALNIEDVDVDLGNQVDLLNRIFTWSVCTGVVFAACGGAIADHFGFAIGWLVQIAIGMLHLAIQYIPNIPVQVVAFFSYTGLQELCFAFLCSYIGIRLSWNYQNSLVGMVLFCCGAANLLVEPIINALVSSRPMETLFLPSLISFTVIGLVTLSYPVYLYKTEGFQPAAAPVVKSTPTDGSGM